jgi:hypothetical protein
MIRTQEFPRRIPLTAGFQELSQKTPRTAKCLCIMIVITIAEMEGTAIIEAIPVSGFIRVNPLVRSSYLSTRTYKATI